jgi:hypothetical protein
MNENRCHCGKLAPWMLRVVEQDDMGVLDEHATDIWAACDEHLAEAARSLRLRNDEPRWVMVLREES